MSKAKPPALAGPVRGASILPPAATSSPKLSHSRTSASAASSSPAGSAWTSAVKTSESPAAAADPINVDGKGVARYAGTALAASDAVPAAANRSGGSPLPQRAQRPADRGPADGDVDPFNPSTGRTLENFADLYGSLNRRGTLPRVAAGAQQHHAAPSGDSYLPQSSHPAGTLSGSSRADAQPGRGGDLLRGSVGRLCNAVGSDSSVSSGLEGYYSISEGNNSGGSGGGSNNRFGSLDRTAALRHYGYRDRSLERSGEYSHGSRVQRNRSLDRDYPLLAVSSRSLDRCDAPISGCDVDGYYGVGIESLYHPGAASVAADTNGSVPTATSARYAANTSAAAVADSLAGVAGQSHSLLIVRLQTQLLELGKELGECQRELEQNKSQLNSYIASVKTFWSPELKKERAARKDESAKAARFAEQLRQLQNDKQICQVRIQNLEDRLNLVGLKEEANMVGGGAAAAAVAADAAAAKRDRDRLEKEATILRKTVDEMELRIDIQRKTLAARDASVKKLVEMLQTKLAGSGSLPGSVAASASMSVASVLDGESEREQLRKEAASLEQRLQQCEAARLEAVGKAGKLQEVLDASRAELKEAQASLSRMTRDSRHLDDVQAMLDQRATRISELESELKANEVEISRLRSANGQHSAEEQQQMEALHSHEKLLKTKIENMKAELLGKANEIVVLKSRVESLETQNVDLQQHIDVLKQHVETKTKTLEMQRLEIHNLGEEVKDKTSIAEKKSAQLEGLKSEKLRLEGEAAELRLQSEFKDKKMSALEKKVSSLEQQLVESAMELESVRASLSALLQQSSDTSSVVAGLEEAISERDRIVERLKREKEEVLKEHTLELQATEKTAEELRQRVDALERDLSGKQVELLDLQGEHSDLRSDKLKQDSRLHQLECNNSQAARELEELRSAYDKLAVERGLQADNVVRLQSNIEAANREAARCSEQTANAQIEVDRLNDVVKAMETEKHSKDNQIYELTEQLKEVKQKYVLARRSQHFDRAVPNVPGGGSGGGSGSCEEVRPQSTINEPDPGRIGSSADSNASKQPTYAQLEERVEELEEALRQSVRITAERELVVADLQRHAERFERQLTQAKTEISILRAYDRSEHTKELEEALREKEEQLRKLSSERVRHTEEAYEMKQEAILAAISEKDTHIALLETSKSKTAREEIEKLNHEKRKLNDKLKELTRQRMMLVVERSTDNARKLVNAEELSQLR